MAKLTGFMDTRARPARMFRRWSALKTLTNFTSGSPGRSSRPRQPAAWTAGVPFCQAGMMIGGMASGCPLNNLIPEWNDLVYQAGGSWRSAACAPPTVSRSSRAGSALPCVRPPAPAAISPAAASLSGRTNTPSWRRATPRAGSTPPRLRPAPARAWLSSQRPFGPVGGRIPQHPGPCRHRLRAC